MKQTYQVGSRVLFCTQGWNFKGKPQPLKGTVVKVMKGGEYLLCHDPGQPDSSNFAKWSGPSVGLLKDDEPYAYRHAKDMRPLNEEWKKNYENLI